MIQLRGSISGELALALILLVTAVGVDDGWVRPQEDELARLTNRKKVVERSVMLAMRERAEWEAIQGYLDAEGDDGETWRARYVEQDPLHLLEDIRKGAGLRRFDVRLQEREPSPPFQKTTYFMSVHGDFTRQVRFLKTLEQAAPLITVESFVMDRQNGDPGVTFKLNVSVLTLAEGSTP
jgi:hypothetical protein